jgi:hypothetical protein
MCSYFIHFADTPAAEEAARARQIRYYKECVIAAFPGDPDYFNVGLKPHPQVKDEMARFMAEIAPAF